MKNWECSSLRPCNNWMTVRWGRAWGLIYGLPECFIIRTWYYRPIDNGMAYIQWHVLQNNPRLSCTVSDRRTAMSWQRRKACIEIASGQTYCQVGRWAVNSKFDHCVIWLYREAFTKVETSMSLLSSRKSLQMLKKSRVKSSHEWVT